ncbi:MAG: 3-deoxy-D-manno-octulosonic acid transferase [Rickettsiales bacterium]|nr:3-deoxy-D-manno-octulosonic acid transferase [Rickettsiales bacterium]
MRLPYLTLYRLASWAATPLLPLWLRFRVHKGKEDPLRYQEKLGRIAMSRPEGKLIWIHASSVGESLSVLPLIEEISKRKPGVKLLVTTGTKTSAHLLENKLPDNAIHQYAPIDSPRAIGKFLKHWQPALALFIESEIWPNLITLTHKTGCDMRLINARMSRRSFERWKKFPAGIIPLLDCFEAIYPQNTKSADHFRELGAQGIKHLGNLKYDAPPLPADSKAAGEVISAVRGRPLWLAASTHAGEETMAGNVHRILREIHEDLLTIIVPRHNTRGENIATELRAMGLKVACRSKKDPITSETDIYLADSMGELGIFYRIAGIVFIGGSLIPHGGQNPLEAARLDCAIILGPHMDNFPAITADFIRNDACMRARNEAELCEAVEELLHNHDTQETLAEAANETVKREGGAVEKIITELSPALEAL